MHKYFLLVGLSTILLSCSTDTSRKEIDNGLGMRNVRIVNPGAPFSSEHLEYAPRFSSGDKIIVFTSNRPGSHIEPPDPKDQPPKTSYSHDIWLALPSDTNTAVMTNVFNICPPQNCSNEHFNTEENEGAGCFSTDNNAFYFTGANRAYGAGDADIYWAGIELGDSHILMLNLENLDTAINTSYWDSQPAISPDNLTLYFSSNRPGSAGIDIWIAEFDTVRNQWRKAYNAGSTINTPGKDWFPFMAADNKTLFFASDSLKPSYGKLDFYYTRRLDDGNWSQPRNLGEPFNSAEDELDICINTRGDKLLFSSRRSDIPGFLGEVDLYVAETEAIFHDLRLISWQQAQRAEVEITIADSLGTWVNILKPGNVRAGRHNRIWDGRDSHGTPCAPGEYFYTVKVGSVMLPRRLLVLPNAGR